MSLHVDICTPWEHPEWDAWLGTHPGASVYHASVWSRVVCEAGRYRPVGFVARGEGGAVAGLLPAAEVRSRLTGARLVALPFSDACDVLADDEAAARAVVEAALEHARSQRLSRVEIRGVARLRDASERACPGLVPNASFSVDDHFAGYVVSLDRDVDAVFRRFAKKAVRQAITKAERLGARSRDGDPQRDLDTFYRLYLLNRRRHGIPPQPKRFFASMFERMRRSPRARLVMTEHEGRAVAALITFEYGDTVYAKYEGVDASARAVQPAHSVLWHAIRDACERGFARFDFGRTATDNAGLCAFKSRWGAEATPMPYVTSPPGDSVATVRADSWKYRAFTATFRRMPLGAFAWCGARIFRHFG